MSNNATNLRMSRVKNREWKLTAQVVHPVYPDPPHCPYFVTEQPVDPPVVVVTGAAVVVELFVVVVAEVVTPPVELRLVVVTALEVLVVVVAVVVTKVDSVVLILELVVVAVGVVNAGPVVVPLSTPEHVPDPGVLVTPPTQTVGPGTTYVLSTG